ncbi:hypothetical protein GGR56DRAFT_679078 [Xylariaceae sp. FL0804]|nr:hypothetical protein GGR56DRAFT_679078 [Xylariaceae sp. FL0804]
MVARIAIASARVFVIVKLSPAALMAATRSSRHLTHGLRRAVTVARLRVPAATTELNGNPNKPCSHIRHHVGAPIATAIAIPVAAHTSGIGSFSTVAAAASGKQDNAKDCGTRMAATSLLSASSPATPYAAHL